MVAVMQYDQIDDWRRIKFDLHKKPSVWNIKNWELHGNKAPCHTSITINDFLCEYYCAFQFSLFGWHKSLWLFPLTEINHVKGRHFGKLKNIQRLLTAAVPALPWSLDEHLPCCVATRNIWFEGNYIWIYCQPNKKVNQNSFNIHEDLPWCIYF